jgi:hypothetical protein
MKPIDYLDLANGSGIGGICEQSHANEVLSVLVVADSSANVRTGDRGVGQDTVVIISRNGA